MNAELLMMVLIVIFGYDNTGVIPFLQASLPRKHRYLVKNTSLYHFPLVATLYVFRLQKV